MNRKTIALGIGGAVLTLTAGFGIATQAFAGDPTPTPVASEWQRGPAQSEARHAELAGYLADKLGVEETKVAEALEAWHADQQAERQAAMTKALEERLAEAVADGRITQEQADAAKAAHEAGAGGFGGMGGPGGMRGGGFGPRR